MQGLFLEWVFHALQGGSQPGARRVSEDLRTLRNRMQRGMCVCVHMRSSKETVAKGPRPPLSGLPPCLHTPINLANPRQTPRSSSG